MEPAFHSLRVPPTATDPAMGLLETISQHPESIFTAGLAFIVLLSIPHVRQLIVVQPGKEYPGLVITSTNSSDEYVLTYSSKAVHQRIVLAVVAAIATLSVLTGTAWMTSQILQLAAWVSDNTRIPARHGSG
ncbi:hypothetical protein MAP00_002735 [Monascus purpureus]|nr:hypothetical protein MAP00_002735 [Monascus purpureus]